MLARALRSHVVRNARRMSSDAPAVVGSSSSGGGAAASKARGSSFGQRIAAFTAGFTVAGVCAYYFLLGDLWQSAAQIDERVAQLKADVADSNAALHQRVLALEREVTELRADRE